MEDFLLDEFDTPYECDDCPSLDASDMDNYDSPEWVEDEDGSGDWSDGWDGDDTTIGFESCDDWIAEMEDRYGMAEIEEDWAM